MIAPFAFGARRRSGRQHGFTMIELMVGITLGLLVLAVATLVFVNVSGNRRDTERVSRQIENGRYAMQILSDDLVNAGYFGEHNPGRAPYFTPPFTAAPPDPCSVDVNDLKDPQTMMIHVQGYGPGTAKPGCLADVRAGTAAIVVRRTATCVAGAPNCAALANGEIYLQSTLCNDELANPAAATHYVVAAAPGPFPLTRRGCAAAASVRKYEVHIYFVANNNNAGDGIPTLKRAELTAGAFTIVPLVEGIESLQVEYGLDTDSDSAPDVLTASPGTYLGCAGAVCSRNWANAMTARVHLLARTTEGTPGQVDAKTFNLGTDEAGDPIQVGPFSDGFKRHAYSATIRMNNPAGRRE
jgi:type IV pilus assembly protein PilW